eukprot:TRINITY_DN37411_c0_g1_i1.p1 TRINITY_DN37411_c0_g1~~TRINITY_DN37411_c0_g1_i1.p1  ORF type:complete len:379 (-),score=46.93 TRINITY_DN37411_c0_g1_i1:271-1407(-)
MASAPHEEHPRIKGYVLQDRLGDGGSGNVYWATKLETDTQEDFAVKVYSSGNNEDKQRHFDRETRMLKMVAGHPNVVALHACLSEPMAILMPRYGRDLHRHVQESDGLSETPAARVMEDLLRAVKHIHDRRVMHRDIKPANISMLGNNHGVVLLDFDIACTFEDKASRRVKCGTPGYVAPEIIVGKPCHRKSDLFSVGCVFYFLFAREQPFHAGPGAEKEIHRKAVCGEYSFGQCFDVIGSSCKDLISMLLEPQPRNRLSAHEALWHRWLVERSLQQDSQGSCTDDAKLMRVVRTSDVAVVKEGRRRIFGASRSQMAPTILETTEPDSSVTALADSVDACSSAPVAVLGPADPAYVQTGAPRPSSYFLRVHDFVVASS